MKAVNLIPNDLRGSGGGAPTRTGIGVYLVLGALAAIVVLATTWGVLERSAAAKQAEVTQARQEADTLEARAGALEPYARFATVRDKRVETVTSLSRNRFNWPHAIRELSRVTPKSVWFTAMKGTVAPGVNVNDVSTGDTSTLRSALQVPAVEIEGCSTSQSDVARYMTGLRRIDGVTRVSLASSEKTDQTGGASTPRPQRTERTAPAAGGDCRGDSSDRPKFGIVVFFERSTATASTGAPSGAAAAPAPTTDASKGTQK